MATNFPTSLDNFTNPTANDSLNIPSHSLQHANANDAIEAIEAKLGVGSSLASSAAANSVMRADGSGSTTWGLPDGLVHLNTTSVTSATSTTISNVFTSAYQTYRIIISSASASATALVYQNTSGGTPAATNYSYSLMYWNNSGGPARAEAYGATAAQVASAGNYGSVAEIIVDRPQIADTTRIFASSSRWNGTSSYEGASIVSLHYTGSSYDGFNISAPSSSWTGNIRVYGMRNS
jgi:hypothetical protein